VVDFRNIVKYDGAEVGLNNKMTPMHIEAMGSDR